MRIATLLLAAPAIALGLSIVRGLEPPPTHGRFASGDCQQCHEAGPKYHDQPTWRLAHGRVPYAIEDRCERCHARDVCTACHAIAPATHTPGFRTPRGDTVDAARHAVLARARPSGCLVCHGEPAVQCSPCHTIDDLSPVVERGRRALVRWKGVLGER